MTINFQASHLHTLNAYKVWIYGGTSRELAAGAKLAHDFLTSGTVLVRSETSLVSSAECGSQRTKLVVKMVYRKINDDQNTETCFGRPHDFTQRKLLNNRKETF